MKKKKPIVTQEYSWLWDNLLEEKPFYLSSEDMHYMISVLREYEMLYAADEEYEKCAALRDDVEMYKDAILGYIPIEDLVCITYFYFSEMGILQYVDSHGAAFEFHGLKIYFYLHKDELEELKIKPAGKTYFKKDI
jgi:hypothetical protein